MKSLALLGSLLSACLLAGCGAEPEPQTPATVGADEASTPSTPPRGKVAACTTDASCNADPAVSALWGTCDTETGKCSCREGATLDPIGERCRPSGP